MTNKPTTSGYYWVRHLNEWMPALLKKDGSWRCFGCDESFEDCDFEEINLNRIEPEDENLES